MSNLDRISELLEVVQYQNYVMTCCLWHDDRRPSLMIREDTYYCLACGAHGKTINLINNLSNIPTTPRTKFYKSHNPFTRWMHKWDISEIVYIANKNLRKSPSEYLRKRGIPDKVQIELSLGILENWIIIPIRNEYDKIISAVARAGDGNLSSSKYILPPDTDSTLIYTPSWERIKQSDKVYAIFGIIDAITLYMYDVASFSTITGKRMTDTSILDKIRKPIIFIPDAHEEVEAMKLANTLGWRGRCLFIDYPDGTKDINDIHNCNHELLKNILKG